MLQCIFIFSHLSRNSSYTRLVYMLLPFQLILLSLDYSFHRPLLWAVKIVRIVGFVVVYSNLRLLVFVPIFDVSLLLLEVNGAQFSARFFFFKI